jgi:glycosyltransferase involved in cell wall biosynthesis
MGIPVAGYCVGALPEILNNNRLLAPSGDYKKLFHIIGELLDNQEKRLQIGVANYLRAKELFSVEAMIKSYRQLHEETITST